MVVKKELCWNFITKWRKFILFLRVITEDYKNNIIVIIRLGYRSHLGLLSHSTIYNVPMFEIALINNGNYVYRRLQECHLRKCSGRSTSGPCSVQPKILTQVLRYLDQISLLRHLLRPRGATLFSSRRRQRMVPSCSYWE